MDKKLKLDDFYNRDAFRGFIVCITMSWFLLMTGCFTFINYALIIFQESNTTLDPHVAAIILGKIVVIYFYLCAKPEVVHSIFIESDSTFNMVYKTKNIFSPHFSNCPNIWWFDIDVDRWYTWTENNSNYFISWFGCWPIQYGRVHVLQWKWMEYGRLSNFTRRFPCICYIHLKCWHCAAFKCLRRREFTTKCKRLQLFFSFDQIFQFKQFLQK